MNNSPFGLNGIENGDDEPMAMQATIVNSSHEKSLTIISGEFNELNGKIIAPGQKINLNLLIPVGYREYLNEDSILGRHIIYVGLRDKDAAEPLFYRPSV